MILEAALDEDDEDDGDDECTLRGEPGCDVIESGDAGVLFLDQLKTTFDPSERTDFPNFRSLLWRAMAQFPDRVEPRSRELSPLLLRFIKSVFISLEVRSDGGFLKSCKVFLNSCLAGMSFTLPTCWRHHLKT